MTFVPGAPDRPDFTPDAQWTPTPLVYESGTISADKVYPLTYVGNYGALSVLASNLAVAVGWQLTALWYADAAGADLIDGATFHTNTGKLMAGALPNRGPFVQLTLRATDYAVARAYRLSVYPRLDASSGAGPVGQGNLFATTGLVIAAGATVKVGQAAYSTFGTGLLSVNCTAINWRAVVFGEDSSGATAQVTGAVGGGGPKSATSLVSFNGYLPAVWVNNYDAAGQTFDIGLAVQLS